MNINLRVGIYFPLFFLSFAVLNIASGATFTTSLAEYPDEPVPAGVMPANWVEHPFQESNPEPDLTDGERRSGFMVFSRPITEPVYRETKPLNAERVSSLRGFAAQGEQAQFNFAVYPDRDIDGFGAVADVPFSATLEQITYSPFIYVHYQTKGRYRIGPAYLVPAARTALRKGEPLRYVLAIKIPENAKPGRYCGVIRFGHKENPSVKTIPLELTVLPFRLKQDPSQYRTAYVGARYDIAKAVEYGFSIPGTIYIDYDRTEKRFYVRGLDELEARWKACGGAQPRRYIALANFCGILYRKYMKKSHVKGSIEMPPDDMFQEIEVCGRAFLEKWKAEGRPELFVILADEPRVEDREYVSRLFESAKKAGFNTFVTSWSKRDPRLDALLSKHVDVYCDQFFITPEERAASGKREHWCYPNHNVYEIKDAPTMARGSRMTWGFGMWKMGDTTLVPWAWSWKMNTSDIPQLARGTQIMKPDGTEWIEWIWEGAFAGAMDAAYIYTLQDAVFRRGGPAEARKLLQELYASVPAQAKYLASNHWTGERFDTSRALIAEMIVKTLQYREKTQDVCPSVLPGLKWNGMTSNNNGVLPEAEKSGCLVRRKLSEMPIWPCETGCKVKRLSDGAFRSTITVNHETSEDGGHYKRSSPAVAVNLSKGNPPVNLNDYGFLRFDIRYHSNRSAEQVGKWPHSILFTSSSEAGKRTHSSILPDTEPAADQWHSCLYSLDRLNFSAIERRNISLLRWMFMERDYNHGDVLEFEIRNAELIGAKCPIVLSFSASAAISPAQSVVWNARVFGPIPPSGAKGKIVMRRSDGTVVGLNGISVTQPEAKGVLIPQKPLAAGEYLLEIMFDKVDGVQGPKAKCSMRVVDLACR